MRDAAGLPQPATSVDVNVLDTKGPENKRKGIIAIDSRAAESVIPPGTFEEVSIKESAGSRAGFCYIAANGGKTHNMGEKHTKFRTKEGMNSSLERNVPGDSHQEATRISIHDRA